MPVSISFWKTFTYITYLILRIDDCIDGTMKWFISTYSYQNLKKTVKHFVRFNSKFRTTTWIYKILQTSSRHLKRFFVKIFKALISPDAPTWKIPANIYLFKVDKKKVWNVLLLTFYFTLFSSFSVVNFEQVNVSWGESF